MSKAYHHGNLRASLLAAAEAILDREGIGALTLRAAAREAGVSHAAPSHHFGDLQGLLTALAAAGFARFRAHILDEIDAAGIEGAGHEKGARVVALGRGYVGFARAFPGLFLLMFRSERLDWSEPSLREAGEAAFALLTQDETVGATSEEGLVVATSRWALAHGLAMLLLDGRLEAKGGGDVSAVIEQVLTRFARQEAPTGAAG